ncbi:MAG: alpha/beta hydrolase [Mogibacterium sp.]|nr:alpha/beta hydrolase [Mogibacterium sp.]
MKTERIYLYNDRTDVWLNTYILDTPISMPEGVKRPAVLVCPGGGYFNCSEAEGEPVAMKFISMGYDAFVLEYSTYLGAGTTFPDITQEMPVKEECLYPNNVREIGMAFRIINSNADEWNVDSRRIAVCGFSAGGHNAAMYATNWHTDIISGYLGGDREIYRPAAAILGYPLTDYVYKNKAEKSMPSFVQDFFHKSDLIFLGSENPDQDLLKKVSPARNISDNTPPTFIWATAGDGLVPVQHSIIMANALAEHKIPFELHIFEEGDHGLSLATQATAMSKSQIKADAGKWSDLAGVWLEKRFALDLPDMAPFEVAMAEGRHPGQN